MSEPEREKRERTNQRWKRDRVSIQREKSENERVTEGRERMSEPEREKRERANQ